MDSIPYRIFFFMPSDDVETGGNAAVAHGNPRVGGYGDGGSNSRNHFEFDTGRNQFQRFLATTPKHKRVSPLETHNGPIGLFLSILHQQFVDFGLLYLVVRRHLAHVHHLRRRIAEPENRRGNEPVVNHYVRRLQDFLATQCQEPRVSGTCSNQIDFSFHPPKR